MLQQFITFDECLNYLNTEYNVLDTINCKSYGSSAADLYYKIKQLHQLEYLPNDRIVFLLTQDYYSDANTPGLILQNIQSMINDIDISNFFVCIVTTNPNIAQEYQEVFNNNIDKIPVDLYYYPSEFNTIPINNQLQYAKYQSLPDDISTLTTKQKELIFDNKSFCILPWTSMMISTGSKVKPCCISTEEVGDCSTESLEEIWNSDKFQQLRVSMLEGKQVESCNHCYKKESTGKQSLRQSMTYRFANKISKVDLTDSTGKLPNFDLNYIDARFNNLCNLSCRMCNQQSSSSWHKPAVELNLIDKSTTAFRIAGKNDHDIFDQIMANLDSLERIYFAGGEPTMIEQFYQVVEELDRRGKHDVELVYNINMTKLSLKNRSIFDTWKNFKNISVGGSLDGEFARGEYLRPGTHWNDVLSVRQAMLERRPDIRFDVAATGHILNALHLPDFHKNWVTQGLIRPDEFSIEILTWPQYLNIANSPKYLKDLIVQKYKDHLEWLRPLDAVGRATQSFESIINYIINEPGVFDPRLFWKEINQLDNYYGQDLLTVFPELVDLPKQ